MPQKPRYIRLSSEDRRRTLIEAALACIAEGGIRAFTVDRICEKAQVSRGLITHHFGGVDALLAATYAHIYEASAPPPGTDLAGFLDHIFSPALFNREALNIWLTLWAEISNTPALRDVHRAQYRGYLAFVSAAISAATPGYPKPDQLAQSLICLIDGLSLQHCIDPDTMPPANARAACLALVTAQTGALGP